MEINKKFIIISFTILILVMLVMIIIYILPENEKVEDKSEFLQMNSDFRHDVSNYLSKSQGAVLMSDEVIVAENGYKFFAKYYDKVDSKEVQENWDNFARIVIPKYRKNIKSEAEIENYFNENSGEIYLETGIEHYNDFYNIMIFILNNSSSETLELKSLAISDAVTSDENYTYAELQCSYKSDIILKFNMKVFNEKNDNGVFIVYY